MRRQNPTVVTVSVVALSLLPVGVVLGQDSERRVKMKDLPQAVQKIVREQSRGATIKGFSKEIEHGQAYEDKL